MDERNGIAVPRTLAEACDPRRTALLVYDMQVGILGQIHDRERVVDRVLEVVRAARDAGVRVIFLRHVTMPTALMGAAQLRMWRSWQQRRRATEVTSPFPPDSPQAQLIPELTPTPDEAVLDKVTMSAFEGTWLDIVLRDCAITTVAMAGCALEVGVEPTARHAADLGYVPVLITDACGSGDLGAGRRSLAALEFAGDAMTTTAEEFATTLAALGPMP